MTHQPTAACLNGECPECAARVKKLAGEDFSDPESQRVLDAIADALVRPLAIMAARDDYAAEAAGRPVLIVTEIRNTCGACPSQWEGRTEDGRHVYVRYRWGHLTIGVGDTHNAAVDGRGDVFEQQLGDSFDGFLDYAELKQATRDVVRWPDDESNALLPDAD